MPASVIILKLYTGLQALQGYVNLQRFIQTFKYPVCHRVWNQHWIL